MKQPTLPLGDVAGREPVHHTRGEDHANTSVSHRPVGFGVGLDPQAAPAIELEPLEHRS